MSAGIPCPCREVTFAAGSRGLWGHLQLPLVGVSWGVGIRFADQLHILAVQVPVAIKALDGDFWLICRGGGKGRRAGGEKERGEGCGEGKWGNEMGIDEGAVVREGERAQGEKGDGTRNVGKKRGENEIGRDEGTRVGKGEGLKGEERVVGKGGNEMGSDEGAWVRKGLKGEERVVEKRRKWNRKG